MDIYKLYRDFWDYSFNNPEKIKPTHVAIYSFAIEHCNRLGWKPKFGFPTSMAMEATGIKSYSVFKKHFDDLVNYGFILLITASKNQYSSNVIALKENYKAHDKALDKALIKHTSKQVQSTCESTIQSIDSINKQVYNIQINKEQENGTGDESPTLSHKKTIEERKMLFKESLRPFIGKYSNEMLKEFFEYWTETNEQGTKFRKEKEKFFDLSRRLVNWSNREKNKTSIQKQNEPYDIKKEILARNTPNAILNR